MRSRKRIVFSYSNTRVVGSNPARGMDVCLCFFCVGSSLVTGWSPVKGVPPTVCNIHSFRFTLNRERPESLILQWKKRTIGTTELHNICSIDDIIYKHQTELHWIKTWKADHSGREVWQDLHQPED
jgi:hypothetical protein